MKQRINNIQNHKSNGKKLTATLLLSLGLVAAAGQTVFAGQKSADQLAPTYREAPIYPKQAATEGIEGYVQLTYTVNRDGSVSNGKVTKSHPSGVFDQAALNALKTWKYKKLDKSVDDVSLQLDFVLGPKSAQKAPKPAKSEIIAVTAKPVLAPKAVK